MERLNPKRLDEFPQVVRIDPVGRCNFRCVHCPVGIHGTNRPRMTFDTFKTIYKRLPATPRVLVLYHGGESLLNQQLELFIRYAKDHKTNKVLFNTNASLLTLRRAEQLADAGLDELRVSFDGSSAEENDKIRRGGNFVKQAAVVKEAARLLNITIYNVKFDGSPAPATYLKDYFGDSVKYRTEIARVWAHEDKNNAPSIPVTYCNPLFETFTILSDGDVVSCCEDLLKDYCYGNVLTETPLQIWDKMQGIRNAFLQRDYPELCKHCWVVTGSKLEVK